MFVWVTIYSFSFACDFFILDRWDSDLYGRLSKWNNLCILGFIWIWTAMKKRTGHSYLPLVQILNSDRRWRLGESRSTGGHDAGTAGRVRYTLWDISEDPDVKNSNNFFWRQPLLFSFNLVLNYVYHVLRTMWKWLPSASVHSVRNVKLWGQYSIVLKTWYT